MERGQNFNSEIESENPLFSIYDLSFIEILIINQMVKQSGDVTSNKVSILRHDLYKQINDLVKSHKKLSTSSFYRSLKKLQERGFVEEKKSSDVNYRNAIEVYSTTKAGEVLGFVMHFMVQYNQDLTVLEYIESNLLEQLEPYISLQDIRIVRIIDPSISIYSPADLITSILPDAMRIMQILGRLILTSPGIGFSINPLTTEQIFDWNDPENLSDLIIFPLYGKNSNFQGLGYLDILEKTKRLLKPGRYLLLIHLEQIDSDHHYVDVFRNLLDQTSYFETYDSPTLTEQLQSIGMNTKNQFSHRGVSFILVEYS